MPVVDVDRAHNRLQAELVGAAVGEVGLSFLNVFGLIFGILIKLSALIV